MSPRHVAAAPLCSGIDPLHLLLSVHLACSFRSTAPQCVLFVETSSNATTSYSTTPLLHPSPHCGQRPHMHVSYVKYGFVFDLQTIKLKKPTTFKNPNSLMFAQLRYICLNYKYLYLWIREQEYQCSNRLIG